MNTKSFLARYYAILVASTVASSVAGVVFGMGLYQIIMDRNVPEGTWFANFFQALIAAFAGLCAAVAIHAVICTKAARIYLAERSKRSIILKLVFTPVAFIVLSLTTTQATFSYLYFPEVFALPLVITLFVFAPLGSWRVRLTGIGICVLLMVASGFVGKTDYKLSDDKDYADSFQSWNGPLMLMHGNSAAIADGQWKSLYVAAPYNNESYSYVTLQSRLVHPDGAEDNITVSMRNTSIDEVCSYPTSCTKVADTKLGPLYRAEYSSGYVIAVPKGHLEIDDDKDGAITIANSLEPVDATQFVAVVKDLE